MKTFKFLRILFLAIFSLSIISCTNNGEDDDLGSQSPMPDKGYKKLVQMNIKEGVDVEEKCYFNYNKDGILTSVDIAGYYDGLFEGTEKFYLKWDKNVLYFSENGVEYEEYYKISDNKVVEGLWDTNAPKFKYDNNNRLFTDYDNNNRTVFTWEEGKLIRTNHTYVTASESYSLTRTETAEYEYSSSAQERCNGFFPNMALHYGECYEFCAIPWMLGMEQQNLPQKIQKESIEIYENGDYTNIAKSLRNIVFTYSYYDDGYLKTCTEIETYTQNVGTEAEYIRVIESVFEYFWE